MKEKNSQYRRTQEILNKVRLWQPSGIQLLVFQDLESIKGTLKSYYNCCPC